MRTVVRFTGVVVLGALVLAAGTGLPARAEQGHGGSGERGGTSHEGHGSSGNASDETHRSGGHGTGVQGVLIRQSTVQGSGLVYRLYSWEERNAMMKGMEGHAMAGMDDSGRSTHHLMVFLTGADGKELSGGKVGFIVTGPDNSEFKTLTMAMGGGYGADVPLKAKGVYRVKTKAVFGERILTEEFAYTVQ